MSLWLTGSCCSYLLSENQIEIDFLSNTYAVYRCVPNITSSWTSPQPHHLAPHKVLFSLPCMHMCITGKQNQVEFAGDWFLICNSVLYTVGYLIWILHCPLHIFKNLLIKTFLLPGLQIFSVHVLLIDTDEKWCSCYEWHLKTSCYIEDFIFIRFCWSYSPISYFILEAKLFCIYCWCHFKMTENVISLYANYCETFFSQERFNVAALFLSGAWGSRLIIKIFQLLTILWNPMKMLDNIVSQQNCP